MTTTIDVRRADTRPRTALPWLDSRHSFSLGVTTTTHLFVARGAAELEGAVRLAAGDAVRLTEGGRPRLVADPTDGAEVLIWESHG